MKKRVILALVLALTLIPAIPAGAVTPAASYNAGQQDYFTWSYPVKSYLYDNGNGLTRVEYVDGQVVVENWSYSFAPLSNMVIEPELPIFGGFFAGEDYNFLIYGQNNEEEDDSKEVVRVVRYDKAWNRMGSAGLFGANTIHPFDAGSLRCAEGDGYLYIRTCHEMYTSADGLNHQANMTLYVREADGVITNAFYEVATTTVGYVSHSFNQFLVYNGDGELVALDHWDDYPRALVLHRWTPYPAEGHYTPQVTDFEKMDIEWDYATGKVLFYRDKEGNVICGPEEELELLRFPGKIGQNFTGASLGGLAETETGYVAAYNWNGEDSAGERDVYLAYVGKDMARVETRSVAVPDGASTPHLAPTGLEGGYLLWTSGETLSYAAYDAQGNLGEIKTAPGALSDCAPIPYGDGVLWYVTNYDNGGVPTFYTLDANGLTVHPAALPVLPELEGTAYPSVQTVNVDGKDVTFQMYALKDGRGGQTNYVKVRDVADVLNGTQAQFQVGYYGVVNIATGWAYTPDGSEGKTPFSGDRAYTKATAQTNVDGELLDLAAFVLRDDNGGGYTYYQLRDLAETLDFNVGWTKERGLFVETDKPYDPAN